MLKYIMWKSSVRQNRTCRVSRNNFYLMIKSHFFFKQLRKFPGMFLRGACDGTNSQGQGVAQRGGSLGACVAGGPRCSRFTLSWGKKPRIKSVL